MTVNNDHLFIGGRWVKPSSDDTIAVSSASTGEALGRVPEAKELDVDLAVAAARTAFDDPSGWASWSPADRAAAMESLAVQFEARGKEFAHLVSSQNGMPITISEQIESQFAVILTRYFAELIRSTPLQEERPHLFGGTSIIKKEPAGVVAAIAPWNFPQSLAAFKYAPALAAGCTIVLKPSPETVLDSVLLSEAIEASDIPPGVINIVPAGREIGRYLVQHPGIDKVSFTGSTAAGRQIAEVCGRLLRPVTLELGGKSAAIILDDADLDLENIGESLFAATLLNNGQTCYLCTRILAPSSRYDEVVDLFETFVSSLAVGDALDPGTQIGPVVSEQHRDRVEGFIASSLGDGARLVAGGGRPAGRDRGWFVEPTILADVDNRFKVAQEEIFGPVLSIIRYEDTDDAVRIANDCSYGLGGTVWTTDPDRGRSIAERMRTGTVGLNRYFPDPGSPFGGVKASGIGRELGPEGLGAYQTLKTIYA
ncbi:aldehyde dehydrogenase [Micromonospora sp. NPDC048830]|uniref:aldehyde dehydrogenase n=1 Tax=Micromonospora sp. NPDC048830 TaxID=3364257 RepID=UPI0037199D38